MTGGTTITWYFDTVSPFAWIALPTIEALAARQPITLAPVVLGGVLAHWGSIGPAELPPKRLHTYRLSQFSADRAGLPLRYPPRHPFRSLEVQRVLTALGATPAAVRTAFEFIWREGRDASEPHEFAALCGRLGVADYEALVAAQDAKATLRATTEAATTAGVFGVPTLRIGTENFWGADALPMAEAYLADAGLFSDGEMARLATIPAALERKR